MGISTVHPTSHRVWGGASPGEPLPWGGTYIYLERDKERERETEKEKKI